MEGLQRCRPSANLIHHAHIVYHAIHHDGRPDIIHLATAKVNASIYSIDHGHVHNDL